MGSPVHRLDFWGKESSLPPSPKFSLQFVKYREHGMESDSLQDKRDCVEKEGVILIFSSIYK